jgi:hypothetical protein
MAEIPIKYLVEALAELFGLDKVEVLNLLIEKGISSWSRFVEFVNSQRQQDKSWG